MVIVIIVLVAIIVFGILGYSTTTSFDRFRYYDRVRYCCAYPDITCNTPNNNIFDMAVVFNQVLDEPYMLTEGWGPDFIDYFKKYRDWLVSKYMDPHFRFSSKFPNLLSWKKRKYYNKKAFENKYGGGSKIDLFFAQTFYMFWNEDFEHRFSNDISPVECQMVLGSISMMKLIDHKNILSNYDIEITEVKNLYKFAKKKENSNNVNDEM